MNSIVNKLLIGFALSSFLVSCGGGDSKESAYDGRWITSPQCDYNADDEEGVVAISEISGNSLTSDLKNYVTSDCSGSPVNEVILNYSLSYGADKPSASSICSNTREVDVELTSGSRNGTDVPVKALAKSLNIDIEVYDLICSSNNKIYFGDTDEDATDGTTSEKRPVILDEEFYFVKEFKG